ncbi:MAG: LamG-like jellyroll fold domain-containing protein [Promethearchaeota archaeon]
MLIDIYDTDLKTDVQADGDDIIFKIGTTALPHEIELFDQEHNSTHAHLVAWVKTDLSSTVDTTITMHYGNPEAPKQENPSAVWSNGYVGVWHLGEASGNVQDSTSYGQDGTPFGGVTLGVLGRIGSASDFDGIDGYINMEDPADGHLDFGLNSFTISIWLKIDASTGSWQAPLNKGHPSGLKSGYRLETNSLGQNIYFQIGDGISYESTGSYSVTFGEWMHLVACVDTSSNTMHLFKDGSYSGNVDISGIGSVSTTDNFTISRGLSSPNPVDGLIDEVRVSNTARSDGWITTEYNNQLDPSSFYSIGAEIITQPVEFAFRKDIVVDHTKIDADLSEFPMLIDIYDTDLKTDVQADGDDIVFKMNDALIPHEIELFDQDYNLTHAHLVAWVKTDLSSTVDTTVTMYYGSPQASNQENPNSVWNNNYMGVWHLGETSGGSGAFKDSTSNGNHGTDTGSPALGINGPIGNAILFDGSDDSINCGNGPSLNIAGNVLTIEAWAYLNEDIPPGWGSGIAVKYDSYELFQDWDATRRISFSVTTTGTGQTWVSQTNSDINRWYHVVGVYDGTTTFIYVNGAEIAFIANSGPLATSAFPLYIGLEDQYYDGRIDEVRVSNIDRSAEWILAEFRNQNDPTSFYTVGHEMSPEPEGFDYRKDITIDHTKVSTDLDAFPVLIDIYDTDLKTEAQADGDDIIFRAGEVPLSHEIELFDQDYNSTHGHLVAWVKTDLSSTADTVVTMYYGNAEAINQEDSEGVWDSSYMGVWHLSETSGNAQDSTPYQTHGAPSGLVTQGVSGHIGNAYYFDRDGVGTVNMGDPADGHLDFGNTDDFTIEFWVDLDYFYYYEPFLVSKRNGLASSSPGYAAFVSDDNNGYPGYSISSDGPQFGVDASSPVLDTGWRHVVYVFDQDSDTISTIYVDGMDDKSSTWGTIGSVGSLQNSANFRLNGETNPSTDDMFDGMLDEVRISNVARSSEWILTEFNNQNDPSSFYSIGAAEFLGVAPTFDYMKNITIDHTKVSSDLTDFPLLIDIFDSDLRTDVQSDGDDIIFKIGAISLPHEIELFDQTYNSTHAHLVAWVKADLSSSADTTITMYYGNPSMNNQERPSDVWNNNFVAVWHFNQDPSSTNIIDSTSNGYDLTALGFGSDQRVYDGKLGTAITVDGTDDRFGVNGITGPINDFTFQTWFMLDNAFPPGSDMHLLRGNSPGENYPMIRFAASSGLIVTHMEVTSDNDETCTGSKSSWEADTWFQFAWVRSTAAVRSYHYLDGSLDAEDNSADNANPHLAWDQLMLLSDFSAGNMWGPGAISEFRILNTVLPPEWIAAEYANQNDPASFYSVGAEVQIVIPEQPSEPSLLDASGYKFSTSSSVGVTIGFRTSLGIHTSGLSYTDDYLPGTSFSIVNGSLAVWTANVLVSPPPEIESISFELSYPEGEWYPFSVKSPSGLEKSFAADWTCFDGRLIVASTAIDEYGMWRIQFQDRNHVFETQMGPAGGPYSSSGEFSIGEDIVLRSWSSGTMSSAITIDLTDPSGSTWYSGLTTFQGLRFTLPYSHRKYLTISHQNVAEDLVNFPVLVDMYDTDLRTDVRSDGRDIAFAIGEVTLAHEIELFDQTFNSTHAHLAAWVKVPLLSGSSDTAISMYYGNPLAPIVYDSGPVWDSGYLGVWHLSESGTGALDEYLDSSQYKNHGQGGEGAATFVPTQVSGKIGFGQDFNNLDGNYDLIDCGDSPLWNIDGYQLTLEAWVQHDITPNTHIYGIMNHKGWYNGYSLWINNGEGSTLKPVFNVQGETHQLVGANDVTGGSWHHVVATYDGTLMRIYVDGVQDPNVVQKNDAILPSTAEQGFWIGHGDQPKDVGWSGEYEGQIDEVRISDVTRSAGWIQTQFQNQDNPSSFFSVSAEQSPGYSESESIALDSSAPAGVWHATARLTDSGFNVGHRVGIFSRSFIVKRGASLKLTAPGDAISDGISAKLIGEGLHVEYELSDLLTSLPISGATMTMNWTVGGVPAQVQLNDYGDGRYGKVLNTTDLGTAQRWRFELTSSHQYYSDASSVFFLDLSHQTYLTYEPPSDTAYGDDFTIRVTLRDLFNSQPLANAGFASNGTIVGMPVDYGNGTYLLTIDSSSLSTGAHTFRFTATPADSYRLSSSIDVQFVYREVATDAYPQSSDPVEIPWRQQATVTIHWYDLDHSGIGIEGGTASIVPSVTIQTADVGGGDYTLTIDTSSYLVGTYAFDVTLSKANYQDATTIVTVTVKVHSTSLSADYSPSTPVGTNTYFDISFLDIDGGSVGIGVGNLSQVTLDWGSGPQAFFPYGFSLDTSAWPIGVYTINITVYASIAPRYYSDATISVDLEIRKLEAYVSWEHLEPFPNGDDFIMFVHLNISEPGTLIDGDPINGLTQAYFTARNETGWQYTLESFAFLGEGRYQIAIDQSNFLEGEYTIVVYVDFLPAENYLDSQTPVITFTYRPILTYLSSDDYPTVTTTYDTNVTITLNYVDIDNNVNITTGWITAEGASITWLHLGDGIYEVLVIVQDWDLGTHEVNITADAPSYQAKTLTFEVLVQIAYAYARSSESSIDLPLGDTAIFYVDYWDIIHDEAILGATIDHNWTHALTVIWTGSQYRVELPSLDTDSLGSFFILFNVSKGSNYQFGYFNVSLTLRTHYTDFRLGSAVEPTTYIGMVNISVYYGDLDNDIGITSQYANASVYSDTRWIDASLENDTSQGDGYYIIRFPASILGPEGIFNFTVYFNWTGPSQQFYNGIIIASVNIIGEESNLGLEDSPGPTPYLENMTYTYFYSELYSGQGISNASTGNVFIFVDFIGESIDPSLVTILEGLPGHYSIEFNSTIFGRPGVFSMTVQVNWSVSAEPAYGNQTDTITVRVIPRNTVVSVTPPDNTAYGVNATFSFSYDDVSGAIPSAIPRDSQMIVNMNLPDYTISYNSTTRQFHVSFNTSVLGASLGSKQFTISITWIGSPFYANITARTIFLTVSNRETSLDFATPSPTPYGEMATFTVTYLDVAGAAPSPIDDGTIALYNDSQPVPVSFYSYVPVGNGQYTIELNTSYFSRPDSYNLEIQITTTHFYYLDATGSRILNVRYRITTLTAESVGIVSYNSSIPIVLHYSDLFSLTPIGNSSLLTGIEILNGSSWHFTADWRGVSQDYLVTVQTFNQILYVDTDYVLWIRFTYADAAPFYLPAETFVSFRLRGRTTYLDVTESPLPTPYLDFVNFTVTYRDLESSARIGGANIVLSIDTVDLIEGTEYILQTSGDGIYYLSINTTAIGTPGTTKSLVVTAEWTSGAPYYTDCTIALTVSVLVRPASVRIISSPSQVRFLDNITFVFSYSDDNTDDFISLTKSMVSIYSAGSLLQGSDFMMAFVGNGYRIGINSAILSPNLVTNWNVTVFVDWSFTVAPYYSDDAASVGVTVINRVGSISLGNAPATPIGDNMTLAFSYEDQDNGLGIGDAIVVFDCLSPSGLAEDVDFWVVRGVGIEFGEYTILVDTDKLTGVGLYTFSLRLQWNPSVAPYYRNASEVFLVGSVRLIQSQLEYEEPTPTTVPINDNVSVVLTLADADHLLPIAGAENNISVTYKSDGSTPSIWSITVVAPGMYGLVVNCTDAGSSGTNALVIQIDLSNYQFAEVQVPIQIRARQGVLTKVESPEAYFGEQTYAIVELVDIDASSAPIQDAILNRIWPETSSYIYIGNGMYNITLDTTSLDADLYTLIVSAQKADYFIPEISISIRVLSIPTGIILPQTVPDVYWGESVSIWAIFNDTRSGTLIPGATVSYQFGILSGSLAEGAPGNYSFTIDTGNLPLATTYLVSISASLDNYVTVTGQITVNILRLNLELTIVDGLNSQEIYKGEPANITVFVRDAYNDVPLTGASVSAKWVFDLVGVSLTPVPGMDGYYTGLITTAAASPTTYSIVVSVEKTNYLTTTSSAEVEIKQILTRVDLDPLTETYGSRIFNWTDTIRIGVFVLVPSLNDTGLSNCTVTWLLSGTFLTGEFLDGSSIGGPGYFYYDFNTWEFNATTYTLRFTAYPWIGAFDTSSNMTTITIRPVQTTVESSFVPPKVWGWAGWVNLTYWNLMEDRGVVAAEVGIDWEGIEQRSRYAIDGIYQVWVNTSLVGPGVYTMVVSFLKQNYEGGTGVITLTVVEVPTEIAVYAPSQYKIEGNALNLQIPYGDSLSITLFYNDTWYNRGISNASELTSVIIGPSIPDKDNLLISELSSGNYSLFIDSSRWIVSDTRYRIVVNLGLENRSRSTLNLYVTIINIPTALTANQETIPMSYSQTTTVLVFYYDIWEGHNNRGLPDGDVNATSLNEEFVVARVMPQEGMDPGWYEITLLSQRSQGSVVVLIELSKENCESAIVSVAVSVEPSDFDLLLERSLLYGLPIGVICIIGAILWSRLFSLPKRLRELRGMVRTISRGRIPKVPDGVQNRREMLTGLFNEIVAPIGIVRSADSMPEYSLTAEVPELEELLIQLSILTELRPEELDEFRADVSKMKPSEQAAFIKEVIDQELIKHSKKEKKSIEKIREETLAQARAQIAGEEIAPPSEPVVIEEEPLPEESEQKRPDLTKAKDELPPDLVSVEEIRAIRRKLVEAGIGGGELETIMEQVQELPKELVEDLINSILKKGGDKP